MLSTPFFRFFLAMVAAYAANSQPYSLPTLQATIKEALDPEALACREYLDEGRKALLNTANQYVVYEEDPTAEMHDHQCFYIYLKPQLMNHDMPQEHDHETRLLLGKIFDELGTTSPVDRVLNARALFSRLQSSSLLGPSHRKIMQSSTLIVLDDRTHKDQQYVMGQDGLIDVETYDELLKDSFAMHVWSIKDTQAGQELRKSDSLLKKTFNRWVEKRRKEMACFLEPVSGPITFIEGAHIVYPFSDLASESLAITALKLGHEMGHLLVPKKLDSFDEETRSDAIGLTLAQSIGLTPKRDEMLRSLIASATRKYSFGTRLWYVQHCIDP